MTLHKEYDVVIIGAGMVGTALACALSGSRLRIAVLEGKPPETSHPHAYDLRVSAITIASQRLFETIGAWEGMQQRRVSPFREMQVWDATGTGSIHFDSAELGEAQLGYIIENSVITAALHERMSQCDNVTYHCPVTCSALENTAEAMRITLASGEVIQTRLLIGADGSNSWVRRQMGIPVRGWDYDHTAIVTYVRTALDHAETAWQRFMPDGPLAFLPLTEGYSSIVWSTTPAHAQYLRGLDETNFCQALFDAFEGRLGEITECGPRASYPLRFKMTEHYVLPHLALVGDAAHTMHPLAGQGVNLGLYDVAALAEVLMEAVTARHEIGGERVLRRYERWRRADNLPMLVTVDSFKRLFGSEMPLLRWLRNTGMSMVDRLPPLKQGLIQQAMGLSGNLPRLSRGLPLR